MIGMTLEDEVTYLRAENGQLKEQVGLALEQLERALARIKQLEIELEQIKNAPPSFVKPNTPKSKDKDKIPSPYSLHEMI